MSELVPQGVCYQFAQSGTCRFGTRCKFNHVSNSDTTPGRASRGKGRASRSRGQRNQESTATHMDDFFAQYQGFTYNPTASVTDEFYRMCDLFDWERDDEERKDAHNDFKDAMTMQFNSIYGTDVDDINSWKKLCQVLEIVPVPEGLKACRNAVQTTHVNIVDLVDTPNTGQPIHQFNTEEQLSVYTKASGKYFPRENAYAGGLLRFLLRQIVNPSRAVDRSRGGGRGPRRGRRRTV